MTFLPSIVAFDVETALTNGTPSVDYFRGDFRVISAAFAWRGRSGEMRTLYTEGEEETGVFLDRIRSAGSSVVVHNYQFEYGVCSYRFPSFASAISHDTMRLVQVADNGGSRAAVRAEVITYDDMLDAIEGEGPKPQSNGLGLVSAASRWLPEEWQDHKAPYHAWLRDHAGVKKGQEGANLTSLPPDMLEAYNVADAVVTLLLYERLTGEFESIGYDYRLDHDLYKSTARMVADAKGVGASVDVSTLAAYAAEVEAEIAVIEQGFLDQFAAEIDRIEAATHTTYVSKVKTEKAKARRAAQERARFNVGSNKQLARLFVEIMGIQPKFWTKEPKARPGKARKKEYVPSPSFKSAHLSTYGKGGELLRTRRKRLLVLQQTRSLLKLAAHDGRWHPDMRACGTATGRMAGGRA